MASIYVVFDFVVRPLLFCFWVYLSLDTYTSTYVDIDLDGIFMMVIRLTLNKTEHTDVLPKYYGTDPA